MVHGFHSKLLSYRRVYDIWYLVLVTKHIDFLGLNKQHVD